ncbi:MAG: Abortive infection protein [Solirubrobacterales bacterium]|nr:Abortive infection protein [Solirubrobacterales bacterium]
MTTQPPLRPAPAWPPPPDPPELPDGVTAGTGRPSWSPLHAILAIIAGLGAAIGGGLVIAIVGVIFGADLQNPPPSIAITSTVVQDFCFIGAVLIFARMRGPVRPWMLGLRETRVWPAIGWTVLAFFALIAFSAAYNALIGQKQSENLPESLGVDKSNVALAATAVLVTVIAPIAEEVLFRGFVFPALRNWKGTVPAVVLTGLLFGLLHVLSAPAYALVPLALFGSLLCLVYLKTTSLYPCIALHSINNCIAFGTSPEVGWSGQIVALAAGSLALVALGAFVLRRVYGPAPAGVSPV